MPEKVVQDTYKAYWKFIRETIEKLPLKDVDENMFNTLRTNFNLPYIGKLYCNLECWKGATNKDKYYKENIKNGLEHKEDNS